MTYTTYRSHEAELGLLLPPESALSEGVAMACATRHFTLGGADRPGRVREVARALDPAVRAVAMGGQCHERSVMRIDGERVAATPNGEPPRILVIERHDAFVTVEPHVALAVYTADCVPVVVWDPAGPAIGIAHAGWRGTLANVAEALVEAMAGLGSPPARLRAWIAPAISGPSYEVSPEIVADWHRAYPGFAREVCNGRLLDLPGTNRRQLMAAGLLAEAIADSAEHCTLRDPGQFFSYRRDGACGAHLITAIVRVP